MDRATLMILLMLLAAVGFYGFRLSRGEGNSEDDEFDTGTAIIDFSRAFPDEAIRSLHTTVDHEAVFVRLHDNRSGFMRNMGNHFACLLLDAKTLQVTPLETGDGLQVVFEEWPKFNGEYRFKTQEEAADVALWLLASLAAGEELTNVSETEVEDELAEAELDDELDDEDQLVGEGVDPLADLTNGSDKQQL